MKRRPRVVAFLTDGMWSHDVANAVQVFAGTLAVGGERPCDFVFAAESDRVELDHHIYVDCTPISELDDDIDLVCIPGFTNPFSLDERLYDCYEMVSDWTGAPAPRSRVSPDGVRWLRTRRAEHSRTVTLGTGVYLLAVAGLLDDVTCTTHWLFAPELARRFPRAHVDAAHLLAYDEAARVRSSAGGAVGLDACLAALMDIAGHSAASVVASAMNLWSPRSPSTKQEALGIHDGCDRERSEGLGLLKDAVRQHLDHGWSVSEMAWYAGMSLRTLQRRFAELEGTTPARWLANEQMMLAARLLEETDLPLPVIAARVGIASSDVFRRTFMRVYGQNPSAYRKKYSLI